MTNDQWWMAREARCSFSTNRQSAIVNLQSSIGSVA
jgi:hypothetical protein